jgi:hypothetical protein
MRKIVKFIFGRYLADEAGQALILVLVFLLLGSLILPPALAHIGTTLKTGIAYENKTDMLNSADAGIEDGLWRIQYNVLGPTYDIYDFTTNWSYQTDNVNRMTTDETVRNIWIPSNVTLDDFGLNAQSARTLIESDRLVVSGTAGAVPGEPYRIKLDFNPAIKVDPTASDNLTIISVGVWLPQGFTYISGNSSLEDNPSADYYPDSVTVSPHCGGQAIVWSYNSPQPLFTSFPNFVSENGTMTSTIYFGYNSLPEDPTKMPAAIAWVTTGIGSGTVNDVPIAWDTDTRIYKITSAAGNTDIEAYSSKNEIRNMGDAASGDYVAVGNSLMIDSDHKPPPDHGVRNQLLSSSDATVATIPADGDVLNAYLYWSGWRNDATTVFSDTCTSSNLTNSWVNGGDWAYSSGSYQGQHTGADSRRYLTVKNGQPLNSYPSGTMIEVSWDQSVVTISSTTVFSDNCNSSSNLNSYWLNGGDWAYSSGSYQGHHNGADNATRSLTMRYNQNLSAYGNGTITVSWSQSESGTQSVNDGLDYVYSTDDGSTWSSNTVAFRDDNPSSPYSHTIPSQDLTNVKFLLKFYLVGMGSAGQYCNLDNIQVSVTPTYTAADGLNFGLYNGTSWSNFQAFRGDIGSGATYSYTTTDTQYLNANFKLRFYLVGMSGAGKYCNLDNIKIIVRPPDNSITFKINDVQYSLSDNGTPQVGGALTASESSVIVNSTGYSYACYRKVTALVQKYPVVPGEQHHTGNYKYTVGGVQADTGNEISYAGWSIIIVYSSPETAGHYLYLRDVFAYNAGNVDADFDGDGQPGGDITGFVIPEPLQDRFGVIQDPVCAHLTAFVGEGDWCYSGDFIALNAPEEYRDDPADIPNQYKLWDGITLAPPGTGGGDPNLPNNSSEPDNVWNSKSLGMSQEGVDIDTFEITWASQLLKPGDTKLHLDMYSRIDQWNLIYFIISVKSKTVTGGTGHYVIYGG